MSTRSRWPHIDREQLPLDEAIGRYVSKHPLVRAVRQRPGIAVMWIVLGLALALSIVLAGTLGTILVLFLGVLALFGVRLYALRRRDRPSNPVLDRRSEPTDGLRLALIFGWVAAMTGVMAIIVWFEAATGYTGIVLVVAMFVVLPIALTALRLIFRA